MAPHAVSMPATGLQALILCGPGSSFPTFTSNPDENPKALLPIANRPMVWYPIDFCYRMGITDITLVCPQSASKALTTAMNTNPYLTGLPLPRPDILAPSDLDQNTGTAEILRLPEVRSLVTGDFVVLPCDLICELGGEKLLQAWMVDSASLADMLGAPDSQQRSGGLGVYYNTKNTIKVKGEETDFIATAPLPQSQLIDPKGSITSKLSKLVYSTPTDSLKDLMEERKSLPIRHSLIKAHPRVKMLTSHRDAHIYIFPQWILDFVQKNEQLESIGEDVVGWWAKSGWQSGLAQKLHMDEICSGSKPSDEEDSQHGSVNSPRDGSPDRKVKGDLAAMTSAATFVPPPMLAYVHSKAANQETEPLVRRVDTASLLLAISLQLAKIPSLEETGPEGASPFAHAKKVAYPEGVKSRTTITKQDSLIAENVTIEEKTSIKETVVGANCQINEGAKLSQCLLMEGVVVGKGCKLTRCILGKRCVIGANTTLTDCEVQENLLVEAQTEDKDNRLMSSEGLEATEEEMDEVMQEMDDEVAVTEGGS